jgi:hypothetical protein
MQISQTSEQLRALSEFQNHCEIRDITLLSCSVARAKADTLLKAPISVKPSLSNISSHLQGNRFVVEVAFEYSAWDSSEPPERAFSVNGILEVVYDMRDAYKPTEEEKH